MADLGAVIRAELARFDSGEITPGEACTLLDTLRAVVTRCVQLSQSDYPVRAGMATSLLRDIARELGVQDEHEQRVFEPQTLPGKEDA